MENNKFLLLIAIVAGVFATALAFTYIQNTTSNIQSEKEPLERVLKACDKHKKIPGLYCRDAERAIAKAKQGFRFLTVASDLVFLRAGTAAQLKVLNA